MKASANVVPKIVKGPKHQKAIAEKSASEVISAAEKMGKGSHHSSSSKSTLPDMGSNLLSEQDPIHDAKGFMASKM